MEAFYPIFLNAAPFIGVAALASDSQTVRFAAVNSLVQTALFIPTAQLPSLLTGRMSWVDIAWPCGLVALGVQTKLLASQDANPWRTNLVSSLYLFQGGRMALGAIMMTIQGHMNQELPRYLFQAKRWKEMGIHRGTWRFVLKMQKEIFMQALANIGVLSIPAALAISNTRDSGLKFMEISGIFLWGLAYAFEHASDMQKLKFQVQCKKRGIKGACCKEGFWSFSRHPNYFGEWGVWVALTVIVFPSLLSLLQEENEKISRLHKILMSLCIFSPSIAMYICLTWWTGAIPAEHYSIQKRKEYKEYVKQVPMFFPDFNKMISHYLR